MADTASTFRQLEPITGVWNPEDVIALEATPWVLVTGMKSPGRTGGFFFVDRRDPRAAKPSLGGAAHHAWGRTGLQHAAGTMGVSTRFSSIMRLARRFCCWILLSARAARRSCRADASRCRREHRATP